MRLDPQLVKQIASLLVITTILVAVIKALTLQLPAVV